MTQNIKEPLQAQSDCSAKALPRAILFDFDGTLIDSAASVLASLQHALQHEAQTPRVPLGPELIGPPLRRTLMTLVGDDSPELIDRLAQRFREHYDAESYQATQVFAGVPEMLQRLRDVDIALYIVTNKRVSATYRILDHLGWRDWFHGVYALDAFEPSLPNKPSVVATVLHKHALSPHATWMVGDSDEDQRAAELNALAFFAARWGYGAAANGVRSPATPEPADLLQALGL